MPAQKTHNADIYKRVVKITHAYLGPAADRFIDRQVHNHLHKEPAEINTKDLQHLMDWIKLAVSLLTDDSQLINKYIKQLEKLAHGS